MKVNLIRDRWVKGGKAIGISLHDAAVVEIVSSAGFNIALIDKEHTSLEMRDGEAALTAACRAFPTAPLVFDF